MDRLGPAGEVDIVGDLALDGWLTGTTGGSAVATFFDSADGDAFLRLSGSSVTTCTSIGARSGLTVIRGRTCCNPPKTTQSSGLSPSSMTRSPSSCGAPVVTRRYWALFSASST